MNEFIIWFLSHFLKVERLEMTLASRGGDITEGAKDVIEMRLETEEKLFYFTFT